VDTQGAASGPYDAAQDPPDMHRLDLGSLRVPVVPGVQVRLPADPKAGPRVVLVSGESAVQLTVFAAPRTERIWDEVRAELRESLVANGAAVEEVPGEYGPELCARVASPEGTRMVRLVGVDGPRWLLRADFQGPAATDARRAGPLADCLRGVVVDRGGEPRPAKEALPLRLPEELAEQVRQRAAAIIDGAAPGVDG
jgi:hypothetical protein